MRAAERCMDHLQYTAPDIVLLSHNWPTRALLRAQLLEEGYEVVATDSSPVPRDDFRPGMMRRVGIVQLEGLPNPHAGPTARRALIDPHGIPVVTGLGTIAAEDRGRRGLNSISRPASVGDIVAAAA